MLTFLLQEGVLTVGAMTGIFTVSMLTSFKTNMFDPGVEKLLPSEHLEPVSKFGGGINSHTQNSPPKNKTIKWKIFLRDFVMYLLFMLVVYFIWARYIHPIKTSLSTQVKTV